MIDTAELLRSLNCRSMAGLTTRSAPFHASRAKARMTTTTIPPTKAKSMRWRSNPLQASGMRTMTSRCGGR